MFLRNLHNPCQVVLSARTEHKLQAVAEEITSGGGEAIVVVADVSKVKQNCENLAVGSRGSHSNTFSLCVPCSSSPAL